MGTRCLTIFMDNEKPLTVLYRQFDGYPDGHGMELANYLKGKEIVNGISSDKERTKIFNGMGCLAASTIRDFKNDVGGFYIYPSDTVDAGADYIYYVSGDTGEEPFIRVHDPYYKKDLFSCLASEYNLNLSEYEKKREEEDE